MTGVLSQSIELHCKVEGCGELVVDGSQIGRRITFAVGTAVVNQLVLPIARLPNLGFGKQYLRVFNSDWKKGLAQYKSNCSQLRTTDLEQENDRLRKRIRTYEDVISHNNLWGIVFETQSKNNGERHSKVIQAL